MTIQTIRFDDAEWQVVPKQMTPEMYRALLHACLAKDGWPAALAVAPEPPAQQPVIQAVFRCGPSGEPGDDFIGEKEAPLWGLPEIEDDGSITVPIDHWPTPAQQPTRDLLAEATEQFEALERENHRMRRCVARLMARLTVWLDDDQFNEADGIMYPEFEPPAQQPMTEEEIETLMLTTPDNLFEWVRAVEMHHGIGKEEPK